MKLAREIPLPDDEAEVIALQRKLAGEILLSTDATRPQDLIAGCDVSYPPDEDMAYAAVVVLRRDTLQEVARATWTGKPPYPYRSGLFVLREAACLLEAFRRLETLPDVVLVDGHGTAHPRRFGLACYIGLSLDLPTIGCGKTRLFGNYDMPGTTRGATADLLATGGTIIGKVLRTRTGVSPVYISPGHRFDIDSAVNLILSVTPRYRIPEPLRLAHTLSNQLRA